VTVTQTPGTPSGAEATQEGRHDMATATQSGDEPQTHRVSVTQRPGVKFDATPDEIGELIALGILEGKDPRTKAEKAPDTKDAS